MPPREYLLNAPVPRDAATTSSEHVWAFDLGKASIGEAVRKGKDFKHRESLFIPAEFAETKTAATKRRMMRTREAHQAREKWLEQIWDEAGLEEHRPKKKRWNKKKECFEPADTDYRLKREFAPAHQRLNRRIGEMRTPKDSYPTGKAKDGAPAAEEEDFQLCYTSSMLRIKLLRGDPNLKEWQIYKALHAAIQNRGYERVPWAVKEAGRLGLTPDEQEKQEEEELKKKEPKYRQTVQAWDHFLEDVLDRHNLNHDDYGYPCYYDAFRMGLWNPELPADTSQVLSHRFTATSTRNIRFHRKDLGREFLRLAANANKLLNGKLEQARVTMLKKFKRDRLERVKAINERRREKNATLPSAQQKREMVPPKFEHMAETAADFLLFGPTGQPPEDTTSNFARYLAFRRQAGLRPGSKDDWMGALGQKIPRFDNRIIEKCALIPRLNACKAGAKPGEDGSAPDPDSLLFCEVAFLMKLKNVRVMPNVRALTAKQIATLLEEKRAELADLALDPKNPKRVKKLVKCYSFSGTQWRKLGQQKAFDFKPHPQHTQINLPAPYPETVEGYAAAFEKRLTEVRVLRAESVESLTPEQIETLLKAKQKELRRLSLDSEDPKYAETVAKVYSYDSATAWAQVGEREGFGFRPAPNHEMIEPPKHGGRSRLSRPALKIMRELIVSGQAPSVFHERLRKRDDAELLMKLGTTAKENGQTIIRPLAIFDDSDDPKLNAEHARKGLLVSELAFLLKMRKAGATEDSWQDLFIPNEKLDGLVGDIQSKSGEPSLSELRFHGCSIAEKDRCRLCASAKAIRELIGKQNDPIVRQRLRLFWERLQVLEKEHGEPARIVLEFAREDFLGKKAKDDWKKFNQKKRDMNKQAAERGGSEREQLKFKLWLDQGGECVYGIPFKVTKEAGCVYAHRALPSPGTPGWDEKLEIDHIVPRSEGGPDAYINYVLTFGEIANGVKKNLTPYDWFRRDRADELDGYIEFVKSKQEPKTKERPGLSRKKIALLTRPDAKELVQKYTALAETAWISRLAQTIIRLHFGWPLDHQPGAERVLTLTGGQTAQFRREFRLNTLLGPNARLAAAVEQIPKPTEEKAAIEIQDLLMDEKKKSRVDPRHHALDAMVLTLIPEWRHYQAKGRERWRAKVARQERNPEIMERPTPFFDHHVQPKDGKPSLNSNAIRQQFAVELKQTHARMVAFERPRLEETHYAKRKTEAEVNRPLDEIAFLNVSDPARRLFDAGKLRQWVKRCQRAEQKAALESFLSGSPSQESWERFKAENKSLFRSGKVHVTAPEKDTRYTVRKSLRELAFDTKKPELIFDLKLVREDLERIDTSFSRMSQLKADMIAYLSAQPETTGHDFTPWLASRCHELSENTIRLTPLADEGVEPESKRRPDFKDPNSFGKFKAAMKFDHKRVVKKYGDICDKFIRDAIVKEFQIEGTGTKAKSRDFHREEWERFCENLRKPTRDGNLGPRVLKVTLLAGQAAEDGEDEEADSEPQPTSSPANADASSETTGGRDEFKESTKSPKAYLKGASHKGYYLYVDAEGKPGRRAVFAHESFKASTENYEKWKREEQGKPGSKFREIAFLKTGCRIELIGSTKPVVRLGRGKDKRLESLPKGFYRLNYVNDSLKLKLTTQNGDPAEAQAKWFIEDEVGLRRAD